MSRLANLWEETAVAAPELSPLAGAASAEVLVIGAGYLGLSAALHLAEAGRDVIVLEAEAPGYGASGRNGGQLIPGLKHDPDEIEAALGAKRGERLWRFAGGTADFVFNLIERLGLKAEARRTAWIQGVHSEKAAVQARARAEQWRKRGADVAYRRGGGGGAPDRRRHLRRRIRRSSRRLSAPALLREGARPSGARSGRANPFSFPRRLARAARSAAGLRRRPRGPWRPPKRSCSAPTPIPTA